jgi:uncharacterized membrane protein YccC
LLHGADEELPLSRRVQRRRAERLATPRSPHFAIGSPVLRHAVRSALALGSAYYIALALPWACARGGWC